MSYLVLARRYRPQSFDELVGQEHVARSLKNAIETDRVAHAYLFTGVRGVGKTSAARILAKALNCESDGPRPDPCNKCTNCEEITKGSSVDVFEIDGASNTGVDDVRELREQVRYLPQSARTKVYIIDEVHMLSTQAFNALLKTLEEPPPHVKFIFATTEPQKIPVTILSRCQRFDFKRIPFQQIVDFLENIAKSEDLKISDHDKSLLAREADGSMRDVLSLLDQVVAYSGRDIPEGEVARALGVVDRSWLFDIAEAILDNDPKKMLQIVETAYSTGYDLKHLMAGVVSHVRNLVVCSTVSDPLPLLETTGEEAEKLKAQSSKRSSHDLERIFFTLMRAWEDMLRSTAPRYLMEVSLLKAGNLTPTMPVTQLISKIKELERELSSKSGGNPPPSSTQERSRKGNDTKPGPEKVDAKKEAGPVARAGNNNFTWGTFKDQVHATRPSIAAMLESTTLKGFDGTTLTIGYHPSMSGADLLEEKQALDTMKDALHKLTGHAARVVLEKTDVPIETAQESPSRESAKSRNLKKLALENPVVQEAIKWGGQVKTINTLTEKED